MSENSGYDNIDLNRTIHQFFTMIKRHRYYYSKRFRKLAKSPDVIKIFMTQRLATSHRQPFYTTGMLSGRLILWLRVDLLNGWRSRNLVSPAQAMAAFSNNRWKKGYLVSSFMGYKRKPNEGSIYALNRIDPCSDGESTPFPFCFAHLLNHKEHRKANAYVDAFFCLPFLDPSQ